MVARIPLRTSPNFPFLRSYVRYTPACNKIAATRTAGQIRENSYSTPPPPPESSNAPNPPTQSTPKVYFPREDAAPDPPKRRFPIRFFIYAAIFTSIGISVARYANDLLAPPALPTPGSEEDDLMIESIQEEASKIGLVQQLNADPAWESYDAYEALPSSERSTRLTTGPLGGAKGIGGYQRIWTNRQTGESMCIIYFGGATAGWPRVTHGGLIATVMDELLGRCAIRQFPSQTGVTANLEITYIKPVPTMSWYVIKTKPLAEGRTDRKAWAEGHLINMAGTVCAEAKGLFVVPKKFQTRVIADNF